MVRQERPQAGRRLERPHTRRNSRLLRLRAAHLGEHGTAGWGFFRKEWNAACDRNEGIAGRKFILPVIIDEQYDGHPEAYKLIPSGFRPYQFGHAPNGKESAVLRDEFTRLIREPRSGSPE